MSTMSFARFTALMAIFNKERSPSRPSVVVNLRSSSKLEVATRERRGALAVKDGPSANGYKRPPCHDMSRTNRAI
jgi:hypothetical protein